MQLAHADVLSLAIIGIRRMPSCLYFSVDIEKWGILLEADSSHTLAFDVEKKPIQKQNKI